MLPDDRAGVHWVVVDNALAALLWSFPSLRGVALDTCHLPMKYKRGRGLASRFSRLQEAPSACQQVQRVLSFGGVDALD